MRKSPVARHVGLALPRVMGRFPYGEKSDPVDCFPFEENPEGERGRYLWTHPAFHCARVIADSHAQGIEFPEQLQPGSLGSLPVHDRKQGGEHYFQPCTEILLSERQAVDLLNRGLMPLVGIRNRDSAVLLGFQSIADPPAPLSMAKPAR